MMYKHAAQYEPIELNEWQASEDRNNVLSGNSKTSQYHALPESAINSLSIDRAEGTKRMCVLGLVLSMVAGLAAVIVGATSKGSHRAWHMSPEAKEFSILPLNIVLLAITECLGYIHATSLRWALFYEGRLDFNANLRLLTFAKKSGPNKAFCTIAFFICMALTYATGNLLLIYNTSPFYESQLGNSDQDIQWSDVQDLVSVTQIMPIFLGLAILTMCGICFWSIQTTRIPSWSSDPLTTVAAALNANLVHRKHRAMMSVCDRNLPDRPQMPASRQPPPRLVSRTIWRINLLALVVLIALVIWSAVITYVAYSDKIRFGQNGWSWSFFPTTTGAFAYTNGLTGADEQNPKSATITVFLFFFASDGLGSLKAVPEARMIGVLLLYLVIQVVVTVGMHCAELQCQLARDEKVWRSLLSPTGSQNPSLYNSILQPLKVWQGAGLLIFKALIHWLFGAAIQVDYGQGMLMRPPQIVYLTAAWLLFVLFLTFVTNTRPKGFLPASYGHLQTMADVADDWSNTMFWVDKMLDTSQSNIRHAGTSLAPLPAVIEGENYA